MLDSMSLTELKSMENEVAQNLLTKADFAREFQYWNTLKLRVHERASLHTIWQIYDQCIVDKEAEIQTRLVEIVNEGQNLPEVL